MLHHKFVEFIPEKVEEGVLYVSIEYCTAIHKCVCGCGNEVVTPLSPTDWKLTFNGKAVTLHPSIGNWNFECQSHYWIRNNKVEFAGRWTEREIHLGRENDLKHKEEYFEMPDIPKKEPVVQESLNLLFGRKSPNSFDCRTLILSL
ncbi:DUF6527 family protein [Chryseobacterium carnipullorum]|nr:DUF6527 family protein [Chryseobacterium carnipullorum]